MKDYTVDVKVRFQIITNDISKSISDLVHYLDEELSDDESIEIQALSYEEGAWFLFNDPNKTNKHIKKWLINKIG